MRLPERQIRFSCQTQEKILSSLVSGDIMSKSPMTASLDHSVAECLELFRTHEFHALVVVDGDKVTGIITSHDLLFLAYDEKV